ncbi:MAG: RHS repeat-associated core domain-containing protein [Gemmataceae bacterium]
MHRLARWLLTRPLVGRRPRLGCERLEDRVVPDGRPLPFPVIGVGSGAGGTPEAKLYDALTGAVLADVTPFGPTLLGGVRVAAADFSGDGYPDLVTAAGPGGGPHVRVFDGKTGLQIPGPLGSFFAYDPAFRGGLQIAAGDVTGDGAADLITAADEGGGPHVQVFDGTTGTVVSSFFAFEPQFRGGVRVAVGNLTGGPRSQLVLAAGVGGAPRVRVLDPVTLQPIPGPLGDFYAGAKADRGGVFVATGDLTADVTGDGRQDLVVGSGLGSAATVTVYSGATGAVVQTADPGFGAGYAGGVRVATAYVDDDPYADVVCGTGVGAAPRVRTLSGQTLVPVAGWAGDFAPGVGGPLGGVNVAANNDPPPFHAPLYNYQSAFYPTVGQWLRIGVDTPGDGLDPSAPAPTGTVMFTSAATGQVIGVGTLVPRGGGGHAAYAEALVQADQGVGTHFGWYANYSGDSVYVASSCTSDLFLDPTVQPCPDCASTASAESGAAPPPAKTAGGVTIDGGFALSRTDLTGGVGDLPVDQTWTYTNQPRPWGGSGDGPVPVGGGFKHLVQVDRDGLCMGYVYKGAITFFDSYGAHFDTDPFYQFYPRAKGPERLSADTKADEYTMIDGPGNKYVFANVDPGKSAVAKLVRFYDTAGHETDYTYDSSGNVTEVSQTTGSGSTAVTDSLVPLSGGSGVQLRRQVGTGSWATVESAAYTYNSAGQLRTATVKDAAGTALDTSYYRYYAGTGGGSGSGSGSGGGGSSTAVPGKLKYAFGPAAYARLVAALGSSLDTLTDTQVAPYADHYYAYDSVGRVTTHTAAGEGCSACTGGQGTYTYSYAVAAHAAAGSMLPNTWVKSVTETRPDGTTATYYANGSGQLLLEADTTGGQTWTTYRRYDDRGRLVLEAEPSAVTGFDPSNPDLVGYSGGNASYLADAAGLVLTWAYATATTATTTSAGTVTGYLTQSAIQRGETGTPVPQVAQTYLLRPDAGAVVASETRYRNDDGTGGQTTTYSYTWQGSTAAEASVTTTLPTVTTGQNGPGAATSTTTVYDAYGRPIWTKNADGFLTYTAYDPATGAATKSITDVNTTQTSTFSGLPSGWSTPTGGGLHLTTTYEVDNLGRATKVTDPAGHETYTVYDDAGHAARTYRGWDPVANLPTGPTEVAREDRAGGYTELLTMSAIPSVSGGRPTGAEAISSLQSLSRIYRNLAGQTVSSDVYYNLSGLTYSTSTTLGTEGTNFDRTRSGYDSAGRPNKTVSPAGTIYRTEYDGLDRPVSEWVGTDDTPTTGYWSPANLAGTNMVRVRAYEYDGGGVGDSTLTTVTDSPGLGAADRVTRAWYDWRDRQVAVKGGLQGSEGTGVNRPLIYTQLDNLGQAVSVERYDADGITPTSTGGVPDRPSSSLLRAKTVVSTDELGRAYRTQTHSVDPSTGTVSTSALTTGVWFDQRGNVVKTAAPGGLVEKTSYDGAGRVTASYTTDGGGDSGWSDALTVTGDTVLSQAEFIYDANGNVLLTTTRDRFHDATGTGALGTPSTGVAARVSYSAAYYDLVDRPTAAVDVGTNGGSAYTRPASVPGRTDSALVSSVVYDAAGRVWKTTDPRGIENRTEYDAEGRSTRDIENYVDGTVSDEDDKTTEYTYGPAGRTSLTARLTGGGSQTTQWVYGVTQSGGSGLDSNDLVGATRWPDPSTGAASSGQQDTVTVDALGEPATSTDRNGSTHTYTYDVLGRRTADAVTALGSGVDGAVRRIEAGYDGQGNVALVTSFDAASGGSIVNQVQRDYNGLGQLTSEWQSHSGAVGGGTPRVQYAYTEMAGGANHSRLTSVTYPNGRVVNYTYSSGLNDTISRLSSLTDSGTTLESYDFLGVDLAVRRAHPQPGVDLTYIKQTGESTGDAGDQYTGLDRFGRVADQRWLASSSGTAVDRHQYGYDRDSNRTYRDDLVNTAFGELYSYDGLGQLASFDRGTLNGTKTGLTGSASRSQSWDYDAQGNWDSITTNGTAQTRSHNKQNEVTAVSSATSPTFDANGNLTTGEAGKQYGYDAWNRLVAVKTSGGTTLVTYAYDGLFRRVSDTASSVTTDLYYSAAWQVLEERQSGAAKTQYVWSPVYVDALVERDRDADGSSGTGPGGLEERLYAVQDANWNVTALVNTSGTVVERYAYDPFGAVTVLDASYGGRSGSSYAWVVGFQGLRQSAVSGLDEARMRWYSPALGRWSTLDPLEYDSGQVNLFSFVSNNAIGLTDPSGLWAPLSKPKWIQILRETGYLTAGMSDGLVEDRAGKAFQRHVGLSLKLEENDKAYPTGHNQPGFVVPDFVKDGIARLHKGLFTGRIIITYLNRLIWIEAKLQARPIILSQDNGQYQVRGFIDALAFRKAQLDAAYTGSDPEIHELQRTPMLVFVHNSDTQVAWGVTRYATQRNVFLFDSVAEWECRNGVYWFKVPKAKELNFRALYARNRLPQWIPLQLPTPVDEGRPVEVRRYS